MSTLPGVLVIVAVAFVALLVLHRALPAWQRRQAARRQREAERWTRILTSDTNRPV
jgi:hypothetical protein